MRFSSPGPRLTVRHEVPLAPRTRTRGPGWLQSMASRGTTSAFADALDLHVHGGRQVGQQARAAPLDDDDGREGPHAIREGTRQADGRQLGHRARDSEVRIGIQAHDDRLARADPRQVRLVHLRAHLHRRLVDHLQHRRARPHLVAFLHVGQAAAAPVHLRHDQTVDRRADDHGVGVRLGVFHLGFRTVPPDLEDPQIGGRRVPLQAEAGRQRRHLLPGLVQILLVLLGLETRELLVLQHLELVEPDRVLRLFELAFVLHARRVLLGTLPGNLPFQVPVLGPLVERGLLLRLRIEGDDDLPGLDRRPGLGQLRDDQLAPARPGQARHGDDERTGGLGQARQADAADEVVARQRGGRA